MGTSTSSIRKNNNINIAPIVSHEYILNNFKVINANSILNINKIKRLQDMDPSIYKWNCKPDIILFISHRWNSTNEPDPSGEQLETIKKFIHNIDKIAAASIQPTLQDRVNIVPTLKIHGYIQAASLIDKISTTNVSPISTIGIWHDFMCLPQKNTDGDDDRTDEEKNVFTNSLRTMPSLIVSCDAIISIRKEEDDYSKRGWCISEICLNSNMCAQDHLPTIVLRSDYMDKPILQKNTNNEQTKDDYLQLYWRAIEKWEKEDNITRVIPQFRNLYFCLDVAENPQKTPFFTSPIAPGIFLKQADFMCDVSGLLLNQYIAPLKVDRVIISAMQNYGISCKYENDMVYCGLLILIARHSGHPGWKEFYSECMSRFSNSKSLILERLVYQDVDKNGQLVICGDVSYDFI